MNLPRLTLYLNNIGFYLTLIYQYFITGGVDPFSSKGNVAFLNFFHKSEKYIILEQEICTLWYSTNYRFSQVEGRAFIG